MFWACRELIYGWYWVVLVRVLWRNKTSRIYRDIYKRRGFFGASGKTSRIYRDIYKRRGFFGASGKEPVCQCRRCGFDPWVRKIPWRRKFQPTPVFLLGESYGQRSLAGYSPWDRKESDTTEVT